MNADCVISWRRRPVGATIGVVAGRRTRRLAGRNVANTAAWVWAPLLRYRSLTRMKSLSLATLVATGLLTTALLTMGCATEPDIATTEPATGKADGSDDWLEVAECAWAGWSRRWT
jgi:hypothetical protein